MPLHKSGNYSDVSYLYSTKNYIFLFIYFLEKYIILFIEIFLK